MKLGYFLSSEEWGPRDLVAQAVKAHEVVQGGVKVCWDADEHRARETVHRLWPNEGLPGELAQVLHVLPRVR